MIRVLVACIALLMPLAATAESCRDDVVELRGDWGQARFSVDLADDPQSRARGLMFRESMPTAQGMLFLYDTPQSVTFWMRNTLIALDIIFIDPKGRVTRIHENAVPLDESLIEGGAGVIAVLEINAGLSARIGITEGTEIRHSFFGSGALWPCKSP